MNVLACQRQSISTERPAAHPLHAAHVRTIRPSDRDALLSMHRRCSMQTRISRWFGPAAHFPSLYLEAVLAATADHLAVVAVSSARPEAVIGLASAGRTSDGCRELGVLVEDRFQSLGVGTQLLTTLVGLIGPYEDLCADTLSGGRWLLTKLSRFGTVLIENDYGISHVRVLRTPPP